MTGKVQPKGSGPASGSGPTLDTGGSLITGAKLQQLYVSMLRCRLLTEHASSAGLAGIGQEALTTGWMLDLRAQDTIEPASPYGVGSLIRGTPVTEIVAQLALKRKAVRRKTGAVDPSVQLDAATTAAAAHKRKKKSNVVVVFAAAETCALAAWNKALKRAAKRCLPIIFVVENNPWALTARSGALEQEESVAQTARRHGMPAIAVDGNDVVAVYRVACESLNRVRHGDGPVLVEGKTYRTNPQRTVSRKNRDPLSHMEHYLKQKKLFTAKWKNRLQREFSQDLTASLQAARKAKR